MARRSKSAAYEERVFLSKSTDPQYAAALEDCRCGHIGAQHRSVTRLGSHDGQCLARPSNGKTYCRCQAFQQG